MQVTKTLGWFQQHPHDTVRANVQTTVTEDDGTVISQSGADLILETAEVLAAAKALEEAVLAVTGAALPPAPAAAP